MIMQSIIHEIRLRAVSEASFDWFSAACTIYVRRPALCSSHQFRLSPPLFTVPIILHYVFELLISQQLAVIDVSSCLDVYETSREEQWPYETSDSLESMTTKKSNKKLLLVIYEAMRMVTSHRECHYREWKWIVGLPTHTNFVSDISVHAEKEVGRGERRKGIAWWFATFPPKPLRIASSLQLSTENDRAKRRREKLMIFGIGRLIDPFLFTSSTSTSFRGPLSDGLRLYTILFLRHRVSWIEAIS